MTSQGFGTLLTSKDPQILNSNNIANNTSSLRASSQLGNAVRLKKQDQGVV